jgi:hypothetical protein
MEYKMADKKSKKEIPDRVGAFNKGLDSIHNKLFPNSPSRDPNKVRKSAFRVPLKDTANAMLESMFGDKEKPKAGPKGYVKKMAEGGKTGMRGQVKKDDMNKKAVNSAVKEAMDSIHEGKINPPKEPDMGVAKAGMSRMSRPTGPDRKEMAYNRRRPASEGRTVEKKAMGGKARGMGAASRGGSFKVNG